MNIMKGISDNMKTLQDIYYKVLNHWFWSEYDSIDMLMTDIALDYIERGEY